MLIKIGQGCGAIWQVMCHRDRDHANQGETPVIREPPGIDLDWGLSPIHAFGENADGFDANGFNGDKKDSHAAGWKTFEHLRIRILETLLQLGHMRDPFYRRGSVQHHNAHSFTAI